MRWGRSAPIDILVVCTGNVCRSPYVAARLAAAIPDRNVVSAGTGALTGSPATDSIVELLRARGVPIPVTEARPLGRADLRAAQLVVTAERRHRLEVARLSSPAGERSFTLLELARILRIAGSPRGLGPGGVVAIASDVIAGGETLDYDDDLVDPYGRSDADYAHMADAADRALAVLIPALRTPPTR